jgi:hypothetical protein
VPGSGRSRTGEVHHLTIRVEREGIPILYRLGHSGVRRVARDVECPTKAYDVAGFDRLDVLFGERCF